MSRDEHFIRITMEKVRQAAERDNLPIAAPRDGCLKSLVLSYRKSAERCSLPPIEFTGAGTIHLHLAKLVRSLVSGGLRTRTFRQSTP